MKKSRLAALTLSGVMMLSFSGAVPAYADEGETVSVDSQSAEAEDNANSWRYEDGEPIQQAQSKLRSSLLSSQYTTWPSNVEGAVGYGVDVSKWQGKIDWAAARDDGVEYAIIRCGYGSDDENQDDPYWEINADACEELGIPYGTYLYSYATTVEKAKSEAEHVLRLVEGHTLSYPIYYDLEDNTLSGLSASELAAIAKAFCETIENAGYKAGVYASLSWFENKLTDPVFDQWEKWVAQWNDTCTYSGSYSMWQCSSQGLVDGISGYVDLDVDLGAALTGGQDESDSSSEESTSVEDATSDNDSSGLKADFSTEGGIIVSAEDEAAINESVLEYLQSYLEDKEITSVQAVLEAGQSTVDDTVQAAFASAAGGGTVGQVYDIGLKATVTFADGSTENIEIPELADEITVSMEIPSGLLQEGRTYQMLHYNADNGEAEVLDSSTSENVISFITKSFSPYALVYTEENSTTAAGNETDSSSGGTADTSKDTTSTSDASTDTTGTSDTSADTTGTSDTSTDTASASGTSVQMTSTSDTSEIPQTGDNSLISIWIVLFFAAGSTMTGIWIYRKKLKTM